MLSELVSKFRSRAEKLWQAEVDTNREKRIDELAAGLARDEERVEIEERVREIQDRIGRDSLLQDISEHVQLIGVLAEQCIPPVAAIVDRVKKAQKDAFELDGLLRRLGREARDPTAEGARTDGPSMTTAINAVRAVVRERFQDKGELERARHLADMFEIDLWPGRERERR